MMLFFKGTSKGGTTVEKSTVMGFEHHAPSQNLKTMRYQCDKIKLQMWAEICVKVLFFYI